MEFMKKFRIQSDCKISISVDHCSKVDHYPICWLEIRQNSEFATGQGYPKLLSNGNKIWIRISETLFSIFRGFRLFELKMKTLK